jgi:hypothetical protein
VAAATNAAVYGSTLTVTLDDGTVLRDEEAHACDHLTWPHFGRRSA